MRILVADDEAELRELLTMALESDVPGCEVVQAPSGNQAIQRLKENPDFEICFSDYHMRDGNGGELYQHMSEMKEKIPFVLVSTEDPQSVPELKDQELAGYIQKPFIGEPAVAIAKELIKTMDQEAAGPTPGGAYVPVSLPLIFRQKVLEQDVFIRLSEQKYVKVLRRGDDFTEEDLERFKKKNVLELFIPRENATGLLGTVKKNVTSVVKLQGMQPTKKFEISAKSYDVMRALSQNLGWDDEVVHAAEESVQIALNLIDEEPSLKEFLQRLQDDLDGYLSHHSSAIAYVAVGIAHELGWDSPVTRHKLALTSFIHDVTLTDDEVKNVDDLNKKAFDSRYDGESSVIQYKTHAANGAQVLQGWTNVPPDVDRMVELHHERPDGKGFPHGLKGQSINPIAGIFIFSEDLVDHVIKEGITRHSIDMFISERKNLYSYGLYKDLLGRIELKLLGNK